MHGVTGKFGLGTWNEAGQRLIVFCQENDSKQPLPTTQEKTTHGHHQIVNAETRKTSISALLTVPKPLTVWITINCGKF